VCRDWVTHLAQLPQESLKENHVRFVVVGCGPADGIKPYSKMTGFPVEDIYTDPKLQVMSALHLKNVSWGELFSANIKGYSFFAKLKGLAWSLGRTIRLKFNSGVVTQMGGIFVLGPGTVCHFKFIENDAGDHPDMSRVFEVALGEGQN